MNEWLELQSLASKGLRKGSFVRNDPVSDAHVKVADKVRSNDIMLPDHTKKFLKAIQYGIPKDGRVIFKNIPLFASPGDGKTVTALTMVMHLMKFYGAENVGVYVSDHLPSLVDALRSKNKPVMILLVDDALKNYSSRGGGNAELLEAISLFTTLRHEFEAAHNTLNGIVFSIFTSQMYKGLDKVFREGFPIFKSALVSDKEEIMSATHMGKYGWLYLEEILRDVHVKHKSDRMNDSLVVLPGYPAGRLHLKPLITDPYLDEILESIGTEDTLGLIGTKNWAPKYKAIEKSWTIQRSRLTREQSMVRLNQLMDVYAKQFAEAHSDDTGTSDGKAVLRQWLETRAYSLDIDESERISGEDFLRIKEPANFKAFGEKVAGARQRIAMKMMAAEGMEVSGENFSENDLMDYVANWLLSEQHFDPYDKDTKDIYQSLLYKLPPEIRNQSIKLKVPILSRTKQLCLSTSVGGSIRSRDAPLPPSALKAIELTGEHFDLDMRELHEELMEGARVRGETKTYTQLLMHHARKYGVSFGGMTMNSPTELAETEEGVAWQVENIGKPMARPTISKAAKAGKSYVANQVGLLFEVWVEEKISAGYLIDGVFDKAPIVAVHRGGGNESEPDVVVEYDDGSKDYVSLKCYTTKESINITANPKTKHDEIQPERLALMRGEQDGRSGRVVVMLRNLFYDGFLGVRVYNESRDIPTSIGFNTQDIGAHSFELSGNLLDNGAESQ